MSNRADALEHALVRISQEAEVLWDTMGGMPVYPELADLGKAILDSREVLVDQSESEREATDDVHRLEQDNAMLREIIGRVHAALATQGVE